MVLFDSSLNKWRATSGEQPEELQMSLGGEYPQILNL